MLYHANAMTHTHRKLEWEVTFVATLIHPFFFNIPSS